MNTILVYLQFFLPWALPGDKHFRSKYLDFLLMQSLTRREMLLSCMRWSPQRDLKKRIQGRHKDQRANGTRVLRYVWAFLFCLIPFCGRPNLPSYNRPWACKPYDARLSQLATPSCTILTPHMLKLVQFYHTKHCVLVVLCSCKVCNYIGVSIWPSVYNLELWLVAGRF